MVDLVKRLRSHAPFPEETWPLLDEAADEIEFLRGQRANGNMVLVPADKLKEMQEELAEEHGCRKELDRAINTSMDVNRQLRAKNKRLLEVIEKFDALIQYQYSGSREAMSALQEVADLARAALKEKS